RLTADLSHLDSTYHAGDLMSAILAPSQRVLPSTLDTQLIQLVRDYDLEHQSSVSVSPAAQNISELAQTSRGSIGSDSAGGSSNGSSSAAATWQWHDTFASPAALVDLPAPIPLHAMAAATQSAALRNGD